MTESVRIFRMALITCPDCRKEMSTEAAACPHCGRLRGADADTKDPTRAAVYNLILPGAGYFYAARPGLGVVMLLLYLPALYFWFFEGSGAAAGWCGTLVIIAVIDGVLSAKKYNQIALSRAKLEEIEQQIARAKR